MMMVVVVVVIVAVMIVTITQENCLGESGFEQTPQGKKKIEICRVTGKMALTGRQEQDLAEGHADMVENAAG